jgi:hypothetical protein
VLEYAPQVRFTCLITHFVLFLPLLHSGLALRRAQNFAVSGFCALSCCWGRNVGSSDQHDSRSPSDFRPKVALLGRKIALLSTVLLLPEFLPGVQYCTAILPALRYLHVRQNQYAQ